MAVSGPYAIAGGQSSAGILGGIQISDGDVTSNAAGVDLRIVPATGGTIVSIRSGYGAASDLYVINEDKDLGTEIGKIITMHYLKK